MKIVIDGNIGSGKTTQLDLLAKKGFTVKKEPIEKWPLDLYYSDPKRWGFLFQIIILQTLETTDTPGDVVVVYERSPLSSRYVFWELMEKTPEEDQAYCTQHDLQGWEPDVYIYIDKSPEKCYEHIQNREGQEGDSAVSLTYLQSLDQKYHQMIETNVKCERRHVVYGGGSIEEVHKKICELI